MLYSVVLTLKSVDEILKCDHQRLNSRMNSFSLTIQTIAVLDCTLPVVSVRVVSCRFKPGLNLNIIDPFTPRLKHV